MKEFEQNYQDGKGWRVPGWTDRIIFKNRLTLQVDGYDTIS